MWSDGGHRWQYGACTLHAGCLRLQINTGCLILIVFPLQKCLHERTLMSRYTYIAVLFEYTAHKERWITSASHCARQVFTPTQHYKHITESWRVLTIKKKAGGLSEVCISLTCIVYFQKKHSLSFVYMEVVFDWWLHDRSFSCEHKNGSCCF